MRVLFLCFLGLGAGCAATRATVQLVQAETAVTRAEEKKAKELAVYEYTMARRFLDKAREENGYADYKQSVLLAQEAAEWADRAVIAIEEEGRGLDMGTDPLQAIDPSLENLPEADVKPPLEPDKETASDELEAPPSTPEAIEPEPEPEPEPIVVPRVEPETNDSDKTETPE